VSLRQVVGVTLGQHHPQRLNLKAYAVRIDLHTLADDGTYTRHFFVLKYHLQCFFRAAADLNHVKIAIGHLKIATVSRRPGTPNKDVRFLGHALVGDDVRGSFELVTS
jgi:hypothetical protein